MHLWRIVILVGNQPCKVQGITPKTDKKGLTMTNTVTISIGRNIGSVPMDTATWRAFVKDVNSALDWAKSVVHVRGAKSIGEWNGVAEESRTWVADILSAKLPLVAWRMSDLCELYGQDAIALTWGKTNLVTARRHELV